MKIKSIKQGFSNLFSTNKCTDNLFWIDQKFFISLDKDVGFILRHAPDIQRVAFSDADLQSLWLKIS